MKLSGKPICTFVLPLWRKAIIVKALMNMDIVILLGNFHLQMSFLGSTGYVMKNSGLQQAFATVYGDKSVQAIMTGKAYERSMRAHCMATAALRKRLLLQVLKKKMLFKLRSYTLNQSFSTRIRHRLRL